MKKYKTTLLLMLLIIGIISISFFSYAYIYPMLKGNSSADTITLGSKEITITNAIVLEELSLEEGDTITKSFTITNTGNQSITFDIVWLSLINSYNNKDVMIYKNSIDNTEKEVPQTGRNIPILKNQTLTSNSSITYTFTFENKESSRNQNINQGKTISGNIMPIIESYETVYKIHEPYSISLSDDYLVRKIYNNYNSQSVFDLNKIPVLSTTYNSLSDDPNGSVAGKLLSSSSENGLFKYEGEDGYYTYFYRGIVDNYIKFSKNNLVGRILRINEDGTIRVYIPNQSVENYDDSNNYRYSYIVNDLETNSTIKEEIDSTILNALYDIDYLLDYSLFCNDIDIINVDDTEDLEMILLYYGTYGLGSLEAIITKMTNDGLTIPLRSSYSSDKSYYIDMLKACYGNNILTTITNANLSTSYIRELAKKPTYKCKTTSNKYYSKVGLLTLDDLIFYGVNSRNYKSADISSTPFNNHNATMTRYSNGTGNYLYKSNLGLLDVSAPNTLNTSGVVINIKADIKCIGGGYENSPYLC